MANSPSFGRAVLVPLLAEFQRLHPGVQFELLFTDRRVDLLREGVDVAFRITREPPQDWVAESAMPLRVAAFAAPGMVAAMSDPKALLDCPLLVLGPARDELRMDWLAEDGSSRSLIRKGQSCTFSMDMDSLVGLARAGAGVVLAPDYCVTTDLGEGRLVDLMPAWRLPVAEGDAVMALTLARPLAGEAARALVRHVVRRMHGR